MDAQNLKLELDRAYSMVMSADYISYEHHLQRFVNFLVGKEVINNILVELENKYIEIEPHAEDYLQKDKKELTVFNEINENAALSWFILKKLFLPARRYVMQDIYHISRFYCHEIEYNSKINAFNLNFIDPLFNYILCSINDSNFVLSTLLKYKHKVEWFNKESLYSLFKNDFTRGENNLSYNLYEYLFDQGIEFHIEPKSESGRPDLIESQSGPNRLVADVKIFDTERGKGKDYIIKAFNQVYTYTKTYNNPLGYIIIFKTCAKDLSLKFSNIEENIPYITHNGKTIFFIIIDIFQYDTTASKRGKAEAIEIKEEEFINILEE